MTFISLISELVRSENVAKLGNSFLAGSFAKASCSSDLKINTGSGLYLGRELTNKFFLAASVGLSSRCVIEHLEVNPVCISKIPIGINKNHKK